MCDFPGPVETLEPIAFKCSVIACAAFRILPACLKPMAMVSRSSAKRRGMTPAARNCSMRGLIRTAKSMLLQGQPWGMQRARRRGAPSPTASPLYTRRFAW